MKIAIPIRNKRIDDHFGHARQFVIYRVKENNVMKEFWEAPEGCGCKSEVARLLKEQQVNVVLLGHLGQNAMKHFQHQGIKIVRGCQGDADQVLQAFLHHQIKDQDVICKTSQDCHQ